MGMMWEQPEWVEGGRWRFHPTCWAAALSSWQWGTYDRKQETVDEIYKRLDRLVTKPKGGGTGTLRGDQFDAFARSKNVDMAWRPINGSDLVKWDLEMLLQLVGYVYCSFKIEKGLSHACVLFGANEAFQALYFLDPAQKRVVWDYSEVKKHKWLIGVQKECTPYGDGWQNAKRY